MNKAFKTKKFKKHKNPLMILLPELQKVFDYVMNEKPRVGSVGWIIEMIKENKQ